MKRKNDIEHELQLLGSPLAGLSKGMPFAVPEGYFTVSTAMLAEIAKAVNADNDPALPHRASKAMPFDVPQGYFDLLPEQALMAAKATTVPEGYFQALPATMLQAAKAASKAEASPLQQKTRIIPLPVLRWAAAAMLFIMLGLGGFIFFDGSPSPEQAIASLPTEVVSEYVETHLDEIDPDLLTAEVLATLEEPSLSGMTEEELEAFLIETESAE